MASNGVKGFVVQDVEIALQASRLVIAQPANETQPSGVRRRMFKARVTVSCEDFEAQGIDESKGTVLYRSETQSRRC